MTGIMMGNSARSGSLSLVGHGQSMTGNRCRADTGSSYSSSDTSSNRSKTSSRRRSHRPRGCRGGSSRKKRRGGKVPKEIGGGATVDIKANVNVKGVSTSSQASTISKKTLEAKVAKKTLPALVPESRNQKATVSFADDNKRQQIVFSDENAGRSSTPQPFNASKYLPLTSNSAVYGENTNKNDAVPMKAKTSVTSNSCLPPLQESMKSFHGTSKVQPPPPQQQQPNNSFPAKNQMKTNATGPGFSKSSQILPPLYHPEPAVRSSAQEPAFQGPNIYALQNNNNTHTTQRGTAADSNYHSNQNTGMVTNDNNNTNSYPYTDYHGRSQQLHGYDNHNSYGQYGANPLPTTQQRQQYNNRSGNCGYSNSHFQVVANVNENNYETGFPRGLQAENHSDPVPVSYHPSSSSNSSSNKNMSRNHHKVRKSSSNNKTPGASSYRNERIEKQRQMMAGGGSLFVTSPKSFLMGWKSDDMPQL